ncbi:hypothetical protein GCM10027590_38900 [Nocardiopsis nanhaiensis]
MTREALDGDDLEARSGDGHNHAAGKEGTLARKATRTSRRGILKLSTPPPPPTHTHTPPTPTPQGPKTHKTL